MTATAAVPTDAHPERASWLPMVGLFLAQILMSFNVAALPISIGGMVDNFGVPPTVASTTIVIYGLVVAALVMTGAKLGQRVGWVLIFRCVIVVFACSSLMMILSPTVGWAIAGQALAGASAAIIVPALVALIAENYRGDQQATAIGSLGSARALSGISAFLVGGTLGRPARATGASGSTSSPLSSSASRSCCSPSASTTSTPGARSSRTATPPSAWRACPRRPSSSWPGWSSARPSSCGPDGG
jgi:MFS family permease